ncbi:MAG TPA: hypothetical protein VFF81_09790 [Noviherbaspirillum sp.]|nr:hypothetical protein [Noviherbaspirillum sp.]
MFEFLNHPADTLYMPNAASWSITVRLHIVCVPFCMRVDCQHLMRNAGEQIHTLIEFDASSAITGRAGKKAFVIGSALSTHAAAETKKSAITHGAKTFAAIALLYEIDVLPDVGLTSEQLPRAGCRQQGDMHGHCSRQIIIH